jgi:hypothetical protein
MTLQMLFSSITRNTADTNFQATCAAEGRMQFLYNGKFAVDLIDEVSEGMIHLYAPLLAGQQEWDSQTIDLEDGNWYSSSQGDDEDDEDGENGEDGFTTMMYLHQESGRMLIGASAPAARLDSVRFAQWFEHFLGRLTFFDAMQEAEPEQLPDMQSHQDIVQHIA